MTLLAPIARALNGVGCTALLAMMFLTAADVLSRKLFGRSILGTVELTEFLMLLVVFFAVAQTEIAGGNVRVDLVMDRVGPRLGRVVDLLTRAAACGLFGLMTWSTLAYARILRASQEVSQDLYIPVWPFAYVVAAGLGLLTLVLLLDWLGTVWKAGGPS